MPAASIGSVDFDTVCTPFEHARGITREIALAVLDDQLRGPPGVRHLPMDELRRRAGERTV